MSLNIGATHFTLGLLGYVLSHPSYNEYTCAPPSQNYKVAPLAPYWERLQRLYLTQGMKGVDIEVLRILQAVIV